MELDTFCHQILLLLASFSLSTLSNLRFILRMETSMLCWSRLLAQLAASCWTTGRIRPQINHFITCSWWSTMMQCSSPKAVSTNFTSKQWWDNVTKHPKPSGLPSAFSQPSFCTLYPHHLTILRLDSCFSIHFTATTRSNAYTRQAPGCGSTSWLGWCNM